MTQWQLKILSGTHQGADITLDHGDYLIGSSDDDDLILHNCGLEKSHFLLTIGETSAQLTLQIEEPAVLVDAKPMSDNSVTIDCLTCFSMQGVEFVLGKVNDDWSNIVVNKKSVQVDELGDKRPESENNGKIGKAKKKKKAAGIVSGLGLSVFLVLFFQSEEPMATAPPITISPSQQWQTLGKEFDTQSLDLTITEEGYRIKGYLKTHDEKSRLNSLIDMVGLNVKTDILIKEDVLSKARDILNDHGLEKLQLREGDQWDLYVIEGAVDNEQQWYQAFDVIQRDIEGVREWKTLVKRNTPSKEILPTVRLGFTVRSVSVGRTPFIVTNNGDKYAEGSRLSSGYKITAIDTESVHVEYGDKTIRVEIPKK